VAEMLTLAIGTDKAGNLITAHLCHIVYDFAVPPGTENDYFFHEVTSYFKKFFPFIVIHFSQKIK
jgi:hypothetical protein